MFEGIHPTKKVKEDRSMTFHLIDRRIISFIKFDEHPEFHKVNMALTNIAESISKPAHIS